MNNKDNQIITKSSEYNCDWCIDEFLTNKMAELNSKYEDEQEKLIFNDFLLASESSIDFWDNAIDDEVWNNV